MGAGDRGVARRGKAAARWAVLAPVLLLAACGSPSAEDVSKQVKEDGRLRDAKCSKGAKHQDLDTIWKCDVTIANGKHQMQCFATPNGKAENVVRVDCRYLQPENSGG